MGRIAGIQKTAQNHRRIKGLGCLESGCRCCVNRIAGRGIQSAADGESGRRCVTAAAAAAAAASPCQQTKKNHQCRAQSFEFVHTVRSILIGAVHEPPTTRPWPPCRGGSRTALPCSDASTFLFRMNTEGELSFSSAFVHHTIIMGLSKTSRAEKMQGHPARVRDAQCGRRHLQIVPGGSKSGPHTPALSVCTGRIP
jgi:hypothetical protein